MIGQRIVKSTRSVPNFGVFDRALCGLNNGAVAQEILRDLISPVRKANIGNCASYENNNRQADANPFEPFFHVSLPLRFLGVTHYAVRVRLTMPGTVFLNYH